MAIASSVVEDVLFSILPDFVHSCAAASNASVRDLRAQPILLLSRFPSRGYL